MEPCDMCKSISSPPDKRMQIIRQNETRTTVSSFGKKVFNIAYLPCDIFTSLTPYHCPLCSGIGPQEILAKLHPASKIMFCANHRREHIKSEIKTLSCIILTGESWDETLKWFWKTLIFKQYMYIQIHCLYLEYAPRDFNHNLQTISLMKTEYRVLR